MARASISRPQRAFQFRGGVRIAGTVVACDAPAAAELVFVSHAGAWARSRSGAAAVSTSASISNVASRRARHPRVQLLTTSETLTLMGKEGERLRGRALMPGFGRPFALGFLRLELVPGGHQPGAAALSCDDGKRRMLYASTVSLAAGGPPSAAAHADSAGGEVRACDALCIDATFADPRFKFLHRAESDARLIEFVARSRDAGHAAVVLVSAHGPAQDAARALRAAGWRLRADRAIVEASALYARCGAAAAATTPPATGATTRAAAAAGAGPVPARFTGKLARDEVLLWSPLATAAREGTPPARPRSWAGVDRPIRVAWLSEWASDAERVARLGVDAAIPASRQADFEGLISYILACGAREVATLHAPSTEALETALRSRHNRIDVYPIGPPRQIGLFETKVGYG